MSTVDRVLGWRARPSRWVGVVVVALVCTSAVAPASAQSKDELDEARTLFREAVALSTAGNCAAALVKYRRVAEIKNTANVAFNTAECQEKLGNLVAALGNYRLAVAKAADDPKGVDSKVAKEAPARIQSLEARVPKLVVNRTNQVGTVEIDSAEIGAAQLGKEFPVDPGTHVVLAKVNGREVTRSTITISESETKTVTLDVKLPEAPKPVEKPVSKPVEAPRPPPPEPSKVPAIVTMAAGGGLLLLGGIFIGLRQGSVDRLTVLCGGDTTCPPSAKSIADEGRTFTGVAQASVVGGLVGVGVGVALYVVASQTPKADDKPAQARSAPAPSVRFVPSAAGADVGGASVTLSF
jgi:hypothetical protein